MEFTTIQADVLNVLQAGEATAQDIATQIEQPKGETAKELGELYKQGVVTRDLRNKKLYYSLANGAEAPQQADVVPESEQPAQEEEAAQPQEQQETQQAEDAATEAPKATKKPESTEVVKQTPVKDVIAAIRKAGTVEEVNKLADGDSRKSVITAAKAQVKKLNQPAAEPKVKTEKKPKGKPAKKAPAAQYINEDGTLDYGKLSKAGRGDLVQFEGWGTNPVTEGIVLFPDWDFWQGKTYLRIYNPVQNREAWKSVDKVTNIASKKEAKAYIAEHKVDAKLAERPEPAWRDWKVELCLAARNSK